ncbi:MAG: pitrilysin family protein [Pseudomonadota bacterium]
MSANSLSASDGVIQYPYTEHVLDNQLKVIIMPTDYPDLVSLQIPVQTGSRNEVEAGKTGFAHFFEHMMFKGTPDYPRESYEALLKSAGVDNNAYTSDDLTNYHLVFPKDHLEMILKLEADRFQNLAYDEATFRTEALAVKGEYLKNFSSPTRRLLERTRDLAYKEHTYKHTTMGFFKDIEEMPNQFDYSKEFFKRWYTPQYTTLIIVGDVEPKATLKWVEKYWGEWKVTTNTITIPKEPEQTAPNYEHIQFDVPDHWLVVSFHGPHFDPQSREKASVDIMNELYFGETSEFYQQVVIEKQWASQLFVYAPNRKDPGLISLFAKADSAENLVKVSEAIQNTFVKARTELLAPEKIQAVKSRIKYAMLSNLDSSDSIADTLASYVHFDRDPETINQFFRQFDQVTQKDIQAVANRYLQQDQQTLVTMSSLEQQTGISAPFDFENRLAKTKNPQQVTAQLIELPSQSKLIDVAISFPFGAASEPKGQKGITNLLGAMLTEAGSESASYQEIQRQMYPLAGQWSWTLDKEMLTFTGRIHKNNLEQWYQTISAQLLTPAWDDNDFARIKMDAINTIKSDLKASNDEELGKEVLYVELYRNHPYGDLNFGKVEDIENITIKDVKMFYRSRIVQEGIRLALAGGYTEQFKQQILTDLAQLPKSGKKAVTIEAPKMPKGFKATLVEKQTRSTAVSFGFPIDVNRSHPDWVALWLVRSWFGEHRSSNSYLFQKIRAERGMNYGNYAYIEYFPYGMFTTKPGPNRVRSQQIFQVWLRPLRSNNDAVFATRAALYELNKLVEKGLTKEQFETTRDFLYNAVPQLVDSQDRQLGYALDNTLYGIKPFSQYVREGLKSLTLESVNRAIKTHLQAENIQFTFVTPDAKDLKQRLTSGELSSLQYNSEKPAALLEEDKLIEGFPLGFTKSNVKITELDDWF